jgi:hypothetical protein
MRRLRGEWFTSYGPYDVYDVFQIRGKLVYRTPARRITTEDARLFFRAALNSAGADTEHSPGTEG